jgi:hypothetical protein
MSHPDCESPPTPSDETVLAAVERAVRQRAGGRSAPFWTILEHLAIARRARAARAVHAALARLLARAWIERSVEHGVPVWRPTPAGRRRASQMRVTLPESPQHRAWRSARIAAGAEIGHFRQQLAASLARATTMLDAMRLDDGEGPSSDEWLLLSQRLAGDCRRLASAWHCLHEWREPSERGPDIDIGELACEPGSRLPALRAGRRNVRLWRERD